MLREILTFNHGHLPTDLWARFDKRNKKKVCFLYDVRLFIANAAQITEVMQKKIRYFRTVSDLVSPILF
jgi:hypothetical protein